MFWGTDPDHDDRQDRHRRRRARPPSGRHDRRGRRRRRGVRARCWRRWTACRPAPTAPRDVGRPARPLLGRDRPPPAAARLPRPPSATCCPTTACFVEDVTQIGFAAHLAFDFRRPRTFQSTGPAGTLGAGYAQGVGAQVALDCAGSGRKALVVAGDGGFLFTGNELATAVQHEIPLVCCVFDDGAYGNVKRIQQQRFGDDRTIASTLRNPDFVAYARAFGALGLHADGPDQLRARLDEAFSRRRCRRSSTSHRADARSVAVLPQGPGAMTRRPVLPTIVALDCGRLRQQERTLLERRHDRDHGDPGTGLAGAAPGRRRRVRRRPASRRWSNRRRSGRWPSCSKR